MLPAPCSLLPAPCRVNGELVRALWVACFVALASTDSFADRYHKDCCNFSELTPCSELGTDGCVLDDAWCEGKITGPVAVFDGIFDWVSTEFHCENCTANCGDPYRVQPDPRECVQTVSVAHTTTLTHGPTVGIEWGLKNYLKGMFEFQAGLQEGIEVRVEQTLGASPQAPCAWATYYLKMKVNKGRVISYHCRLQPQRNCRCGTSLIFGSGAEKEFDHTMTVSFALSGTATSGTDANGSCPPDPPSPPF